MRAAGHRIGSIGSTVVRQVYNSPVVGHLENAEFRPAVYNSSMTRDHQHNPDPNQNAARIVAESTSGSTATPGDLEAAWGEWSRHIQKVDERGMTLLRAAFEAGWEAAEKG